LLKKGIGRFWVFCSLFMVVMGIPELSWILIAAKADPSPSNGVVAYLGFGYRILDAESVLRCLLETTP
jgi:hypothetical protein